MMPDETAPAAAPVPQVDPADDPYHGVGGSFILDPKTGKRTPDPDQPGIHPDDWLKDQLPAADDTTASTGRGRGRRTQE
jgi:hypothetical protein